MTIRQALKKLGATEIELKKGYRYQSGFFVLESVLYYVNSGDVDAAAYTGALRAYYRTAKDRKDFTGGQNRDFSALVLEVLGEPLTGCEFKS